MSLSCLVCRSRKVRCDGQEPHCRNCGRLGVSCPGYDSIHSNGRLSRQQALRSTCEIFKAAGLEKRHVGSCESCRISKSKCSRTKPTCRRCQGRNLECVYRINKQPHHKLSNQSRSQEAAPQTEAPSLTEDASSLDILLQRLLFGAYFDRIYPLRCQACIHKPSFMYLLDQGGCLADIYCAPLINAMCAVGAKALLSDSRDLSTITGMPHINRTTLLSWSDIWADQARKQVLEQMHRPNIQLLIAMITLCEHALRTQQSALLFMLSGCLYRAIRLLGLDMSNDKHPTTLEQEIRGRVVWSSYIIDGLVSSGVDKNSSWDPHIPLIPLPWPERNFILEAPPSHPSFLACLEDSDEELKRVIGDIDLASLSVVLARLRSRVLKLIRTPPRSDIHLWHSSSDFMTLNRQLQIVDQNLPTGFRISRLSMYTHTEQKTIGAMVAMNLQLHSIILDLNRISLEGFAFPHAAGFEPAPPDFRLESQSRCRYHASRVSEILREGWDQDFTASFDDNGICYSSAFESAKIQVVLMATVPSKNPTEFDVFKENVRTNMKVMKRLHCSLDASVPSHPMHMIVALCDKFHLGHVVDDWRDKDRQGPSEGGDETNKSAEVVGPKSANFLSGSSIFRRAQWDLQGNTNVNTVGNGKQYEIETSPTPSRTSPSLLSSPNVSQGLSQPAELSSQHLSPTTCTSTQSLPPGTDDWNQDQDQQYQQTRALNLSMANNMTTTGGSWSSSIEDNIRTAQEMSECLTMWGDSLFSMEMPI